jgi:alanine dehydrogenase
MRLSLLCAAAAIAMSAAATQKAEAAGCLKGAVVGGVAGHYAGHHGVLGAVGGCIVGHHMAKVAAQNRAEQEQTEHLNNQQLQNVQQQYK